MSIITSDIKYHPEERDEIESISIAPFSLAKVTRALRIMPDDWNNKEYVDCEALKSLETDLYFEFVENIANGNYKTKKEIINIAKYLLKSQDKRFNREL